MTGTPKTSYIDVAAWDSWAQANGVSGNPHKSKGKIEMQTIAETAPDRDRYIIHNVPIALREFKKTLRTMVGAGEVDISQVDRLMEAKQEEFEETFGEVWDETFGDEDGEHG